MLLTRPHVHVTSQHSPVTACAAASLIILAGVLKVSEQVIDEAAEAIIGIDSLVSEVGAAAELDADLRVLRDVSVGFSCTTARQNGR